MNRLSQAVTGTLAAGAFALAAFAPVPAQADAVADFYKGKTVTIYVGTRAGGLYSSFAQFLSSHLPRHIPGNPSVIVKHITGAGGIKAMNFVYNVAPKDGTAVITPNSGGPDHVVLGRKGVKYDPLKYNYLGSWGEAVTVLSLLKSASPVRTLKQAMQQQVILGAINKSSNTYLLPTIYNNVLGTKFKLIAGYRGGSGVRLAIEKGEVAGWSGQWLGWKTRKPDWVRDNKLVHLVQLASKPSPDLPNVPMLTDFARNPKETRLFEFLNADISDRAFVAPPGVPADRLRALEKAYLATLRDPKFLSETKKRKLSVDPHDGAAVTAVVRRTMSLPAELVAMLKKARGGK